MLITITSMSYPALIAVIFTIAFTLLNLKALPLAHSIRLLPSIYRLYWPRLSRSKSTPLPLGPSQTNLPLLFTAHTTPSTVCPLDLDINLHKSNSTFFADADISRAELLTRLFARALAAPALTAPHGGAPANLLLAGTQARFLRELRPWARYAVTSRVLAWDGAGLHVVTYFARPGVVVGRLERNGEKGMVVVGPAEVLADERTRKGVFAVLVSRYVVRAGRVRIAPVDLLKAAGIVGEEGGEALERARVGGLEYVKGCML